MTTYIIDTETTGLKDPQVIELGWLRFADIAGLSQIDEGTTVLRFRPGKEIELGALATHHIQLKELVDCPSYDTAKLPADTQFIIGHNVDFDWKVLGRPEVGRICTQALSQWLWPMLDSHKLGALTYKFNPDVAKDWLKTAHGVAGDIQLCRRLLIAILTELKSRNIEVDSFETLWKISERARIPKVMTFGKHKGLPIAEVPMGWVTWYLKQEDTDPYLVKAFAEARSAKRSW